MRRTSLPLLLNLGAALAFVNRSLNQFNLAGTSAAPFSSSRMAATVSDVLKNPKFPEKWPFTAKDFSRQDESVDQQFYSAPRFVYHIDDGAVNALTKYYKSAFFAGADVLDICSSWVSHFPPEVKLGRSVGLGMNEAELKANKQLSEYVARVCQCSLYKTLPVKISRHFAAGSESEPRVPVRGQLV